MKRIQLQGFSLIELMIVVVIIGIVAGIAYPSYRNYTVQTRRSDAQIALTRIAAAQEKYYSDFGYFARTLAGTRAQGTGAGNVNTVLGTGATSPESYYNLALTAGNIAGSCSGGSASYSCGFVATATPDTAGRQAGNGPLRIDATGQKQWAKDGTNYNQKWTDK